MIKPAHDDTPHKRTVSKVLRRLPGVRSMLNGAIPRNPPRLRICQRNGGAPQALKNFEPNRQGLRWEDLMALPCTDMCKASEGFDPTFDGFARWRSWERLKKKDAT